MSPRQAPVRDVAPTVQRLRLRYAKRGPLRFTSTRDFQRALERALRRTGVPMAYSQGFNPHPRISYTNAAPTGTASEAEYAELAVTSVLDPARVREALGTALPPGLDVLEVVEVRSPDLADRLQASVWCIELPGVAEEVAAAAVAALLAAETVDVSRRTKSGMRTFDARGPVLRLDVRSGVDAASGGPCAILDLVVRHVTPSVRPDDVLAALRHVADLEPPVPARVTRLAQGPLVADVSAGAAADAVSDPLAADRG
ncbi:MAG TPA: TIGR03936 family radical SAM-associated protein [Candidatus Nanopelagicales bacterium]|nr:TIGR03936 family radical SAM-associated protein [Candidatus Nanopelagicales bacterium]